MAKWPQKDPRYKLLSKTPRQYRDMLTGELLSRTQFEQRTRGKPLGGNATTTPQPSHSPKSAVVNHQNSGNHTTTVDMANSGSGMDITLDATTVVSGGDIPIPMADLPEPPPLISGLNQAASIGQDVAKAAGQKASDSLANIVGDGLAMCLNLIADIKAAPDKRYLVVETSALAMVTKPAARIVARHLPVEIEAVGPDGQDAAEIFKGVMYCVTAIWANKQVFDEEIKKREAEYAKLFDAHYGPGSYARALAQVASQNAGTGRPVQPGGQVISTGAAQPGIAGAAANGSANHRGDGGRTADLINRLYQQYPTNNGQPFSFG